jgi:polyhydroxyalkanoate synthesis regulator phasin
MIADTVQQEMPAPAAGVGLSHLQRKVSTAGAAGRRLVLASVGLFAYVADGAAAVYQEGVRLFSSAERRGQRMSRDLTRRFGDLEEQAVGEMRKLQNEAEANVDHMRSGFLATKSSADEDLEKRVELVLSNMGLPSRERLERLSQEIDDLNHKIVQQLLRLPDRPVADPLG